MNYWINTISKDHVLKGVEGGFTQAGHGKVMGVKRLREGDWIVFYSPKTSLKDGEVVQAFTALGWVMDEAPYQVAVSADWQPWRRKVEFVKCREMPIRPLIDELSFIKDKSRWGYPFHFGLFKIPEADFELIKNAMMSEEE